MFGNGNLKKNPVTFSRTLNIQMLTVLEERSWLSREIGKCQRQKPKTTNYKQEKKTVAKTLVINLFVDLT